MSQEIQDSKKNSTTSLEERLNKFFEEFRRAVMRQPPRWRAFEEATLVELWHDLDCYEASLWHALARGVNINADGTKDSYQFHYLNCEKCRVRKMLGLPKEGPR